ncbi:MAG: hypothetical protein HRT67_12090 [Flavobacteriaceae bacterium]|nr:hypothetical protein [Flavobacteriaceae bacterium]
MLFNTTYRNEDYLRESKKMVGKPFSLFEILKMGSIGSSRLVIKEFSENLHPKQHINSELNYANIELRPKGIIVHFTDRLERYAWVIPYYRLVIYSAQTFSIHAGGNVIKFAKNKNYRSNKTFIDKMIRIKNEFLNLGYYDG